MSLHRLPYPVLGLVGLACVALLPGERARGTAFLLTAALGVVATVTGILRNRPVRRAGWWLVAAGWAAFLVGDLLFEVLSANLGTGPSAADVFYLCGYPLLMVGLLSIVHRRAGRRDWAELVDVGIVVTSASMLLMLFILQPATSSATGAGERFIAIAYPVGDLGLLTVVVRLLIGHARRVPSFTLLVAALISTFAADVLYSRLALGGEELTASPLIITNVLYVIGYLLTGLAAGHPSLHRLSEPRPFTTTGFTTARLAALSVALLVGPVVILVQTIAGEPINGVVIAPAAVVLVLLVVVRLWLLFGAVERAQAERGRLLDRTMQSAEDARARIAVELHDGPIQSLARIGLNLERVNRQLAREEHAKASLLLMGSQESLRAEINRLRRMMTALRPPALDEVGLEAALRDRVSQVARRTGVACRFESTLSGRLVPELETILYRVGQEALDGTIERVKAREVTVVLTTGNDEEVRLDVRGERAGPSGCGWALDGSDLDLLAMRERVELSGGSWSLDVTDQVVVLSARFAVVPPVPESVPSPDEAVAV